MYKTIAIVLGILFLYTFYSYANLTITNQITDKQKFWALATTAIITEGNHQKHDLLGGSERTPGEIKEWKEVLTEWWNITNRKDFLETLDWIETGGHRVIFEEITLQINDATTEQIKYINEQIKLNPNENNRVAIVLKYKDIVGDKNIVAWDYVRLISLCRWGYIAGYLTEEEAWQKIMPVAMQLQDTFSSWEEIGMNYIVGREFWSWEQTRRRGKQMRKIYHRLLNSPYSPWTVLPWDLDLKS